MKFTVTRFKGLLLLIAMIAAVMSLTACSLIIPFIARPPAPAPNIRFLVPGEHGSGGPGISGSNWTPVLVEVTNFRLVDKLGEPNVPGEGHIHYFLDVEPPIEAGKPLLAVDGTYADTADVAYYFRDIGEGAHTFYAQLVNNDHTPLFPPAVAIAEVVTGSRSC